MSPSRAIMTFTGVIILSPALRVAAQAPQHTSGTGPIAAEPTATEILAELRSLRQQLREQQERHDAELKALQAQLDDLKTQVASSAPSSAPAVSAEQELEALVGGASPAPAATAAPAGPLPSLQRAIQSFNPDISLNADFLGAYSSREGGTLDDEFLFRELEVSVSGAVDPYTRADFFVTLEREDDEFSADLEEGYLTFLTLPHGLQARLGKYRAEFGKTNAFHRHAIPWIDYPLVIKRYFGEEGLSGTGGELSWLVPNRWNQFISLTYELFNNDNETLFAGQESDDFVHLAHLKTFRELSPASNLEVGASFATAPNDGGHGGHRAAVEGVDVTYRWKPKEAGLYKSFLWQTELLFAQADQKFGGQDNTRGMYTAAEYQFARRWKFGLRFDSTELPYNAAQDERAYAAFLTFLQSEFVFWRLGYQFTDRNFKEEGNGDEHQLMLQLNWTLGAHPAHRF